MKRFSVPFELDVTIYPVKGHEPAADRLEQHLREYGGSFLSDLAVGDTAKISWQHGDTVITYGHLHPSDNGILVMMWHDNELVATASLRLYFFS